MNLIAPPCVVTEFKVNDVPLNVLSDAFPSTAIAPPPYFVLLVNAVLFMNLLFKNVVLINSFSTKIPPPVRALLFSNSHSKIMELIILFITYIPPPPTISAVVPLLFVNLELAIMSSSVPWRHNAPYGA